MEELLLRLQDSTEMTLEELEDMQDTLVEKDNELRIKITMVKEEKLKAELETERQQVQEAMVLADRKIDEIKSREQVNLQEQNGLSAYQEETVEQEKEFDWRWVSNYWRASNEGDRETMKKIFTELSIEAEKGNGDALYCLEEIWVYVNYMTNHTIKNRRMLNKAMAQGSVRSFIDMADILREGYVVERDKKKALEHLEKALELGSLHVAFELAETYARERCSKSWLEDILPHDDGKAMKYYKYYMEKSDENDSAYWESLYKYVKYGIRAGEEELKDANKVIKILSPFLVPGGKYGIGARNLIGDVLCNEKRFREAVKYWLESESVYGIERILDYYDEISKAGDGEALDNILNEKIKDSSQDKKKQKIKGVILNWKGDCCEKDDVAAFQYYCQAAGVGNDRAVKQRDKILARYQKSNFIDVSLFFEESAEGGNVDAYKYLGDLYAVDQRGNPHNYKKAMEYYIRGKGGTMKDTCEKQAEKMKGLMRKEERYKRAIECVSSAVQERREEGLNMIKELAKDGFPEAVEYLKKQN